MNDEWVTEWIDEWVISGTSKQIYLREGQNYHSELRREIRAGIKDWRVASFQEVMKFIGENKYKSPRKSESAQDWRQTRNVDPVKVIQKLAQKVWCSLDSG